MRKLAFIIALLCLAALPWKSKRALRAPTGVSNCSTLATSFDGSAGWGVTLEVDDTLQYMSFWYRRSGTGSAGAAVIYSRTSGGVAAHGLTWLASGNLRMLYSSSGTNPYADYVPPSDGVWTHLTITQGATGYPLVYYDGVLQTPVASRAISGTPNRAQWLMLASVSQLTWSTGSAFDLDELAVYSAAQDAAALYAAIVPPAGERRYWWRMGEGGSASSIPEEIVAADLALTSASLVPGVPGACTVPDPGPPVFYAAIVTGPSYFHSGGGTPTSTYWTDGGVAAYQTLDGGVQVAVDNATGAAASVGAIQAAARDSERPWVLVDWQQPSTAPWAYDLAALETNLTAAAAWAADAGVQLCPVGHWDVTGGYYSGSQGQPFIDGGAPDASSHYEIVVNGITDRMRAHLVGLADGGSVAASCLTLPYYDLKGPYSGTALDGGLAQAPYSRDFYDHTSTAPVASTSNISVQADGLHFDLPGHRAAADVLGRSMARAQAGTLQRFAPTAVTPVDTTTLDVTFAVPCRVSGDCVDDPPLLVDTTGIVAQESAGGVATYGLHFWRGGVLQTPPALSSATPQACAAGATSCDVRFTFAAPPDFDEVSFGDVYCKVFGDAKCTFGPGGEFSGGSNIVSRVNSTCNAPVDGGTDCIEQPTYNRFVVDPVDAGPDAGTIASNLQYLASTSGNYVSVANQGGGTSQCVFAWGTLPTANLDTIVRPTTNLRGFMGNVSGAWGCAISSTGPTYRVATGSYTTGQRYDVACCFDGAGGSGPTDITIYVGGVDVSGTTNGAATTLDPDGVTDFPDNAATTEVDEVVVLPGKASLSAQDLLDLRCATKAATDASPTAGECASANVDVGHICGLATGTRWYGLEGDVTDRCGVLDGSETGTPPYTNY